MEKIWGAPRSSTVAISTSEGNNTEAENIKFEHVYVSANLAGGLLRVGYQQQTVFGLSVFDSGDTSYGFRIRYDYPVGPFNFIVLYDKVEGTKQYSASGPAGTPAHMDDETDKYVAAFTYKFKQGSTGLLFVFLNDSAPSDTSYYHRKWYVFDPFVKATFGPVYFEAEAIYVTGKTRDYDDDAAAGSKDLKKNTVSIYAMAMGNFGPAYAGLAGIWIPGDNDATDDKDKTGYPGGTDFNPCLMLFNYDLGRWNGQYGSGSVVGAGGQMANILAGQIFAGIKPIPKLDIKLAYTYAKADKVPDNWEDKFYGHEIDLTATYKIYDNLSYMVGAGYLFAGDYWKGYENSGKKIDDDYLLTHKLTLTF
jgi:hypothetical protein